MKPDILILGAGVIGLALALELRNRGHSVQILDSRTPLAGASGAAAGMLAVEDPHNPPALLPLSRLSGSLYPSFLAQVKELSGAEVPFQTQTTLQTGTDGSVYKLSEHSLDPRQLAPALLAAVRRSGVRVAQEASMGPKIEVHTTGAWGVAGLPVTPRKGQMLRVRWPRGVTLREVHRSERVYVVPRTQGPQAGTALVGATVEDAGFDVSTTPSALAALRQMGAELVPQLRHEPDAPAVEAWAGLRPATPDNLPLLGALPQELQEGDQAAGVRGWVATGHFRNGILLAPGTAAVMADLLEGREPAIALAPFRPDRFGSPGRS